jgi:hypothetical protein
MCNSKVLCTFAENFNLIYINMQQRIEEIKKNHPDEWLVLGNPVLGESRQQILAGELLCHGYDRVAVSQRVRELSPAYKTKVAFYNKVSKEPQRMPIIGTMKRISQ